MSTTHQTTALISGCTAGGLGEALAKAFHAKGVRVFATARDISNMRPLSALGIETLILDVTMSDSIADVKRIIEERTCGKLDILVNNAGITYPFPVSDSSMDQVRKLFEVNVFGAMALTQAFIPLMIKAASETSPSTVRVIQIGSLAAIMPIPFNAAYNASKAALHSFGDTLRVELAPFNIQVMTVASGTVESNIMKPVTLPITSLYQPIKAEYQDLRIDKFQDGAMNTDKWAMVVVAESLKSNPPAWFWIGTHSTIAWIIHTFSSRTGFDSMFTRKFGIHKLKDLLQAKIE